MIPVSLPLRRLTARRALESKRTDVPCRRTYQVGHDNGVHGDRLGGSPQRELQASRRLPGGDVVAVTFQQEVLQLVLGSHYAVHLQHHKANTGRLLSDEKKPSPCNGTDESQRHYAKRRKPNIKGDYHMITFIR